MPEQAFQSDKVESQNTQLEKGDSNNSQLTAEFDNMSQEEQLQVARQLSKGADTDRLDEFGGSFSEMFKSAEKSPELRAYEIEQNVVKGLRGDDQAMEEAKEALQSEIGKRDGNETFKELEEDGAYITGRRGAPHAEIEYAKDADGNDTDEVTAINFSKIDIGLPPEYNKERIDLNNPRADYIEGQAEVTKDQRAYDTHYKALDGQLGSKAAEKAWNDDIQGKAPEAPERQR